MKNEMEVVSPFYSQKKREGSCGHANVISKLKKNPKITDQVEVSQTWKDVSGKKSDPAHPIMPQNLIIHVIQIVSQAY